MFSSKQSLPSRRLFLWASPWALRTFDWLICQIFLTCDWLHTTLTMKRSSVEQGKFVRSKFFLSLRLGLGLVSFSGGGASAACGPVGQGLIP